MYANACLNSKRRNINNERKILKISKHISSRVCVCVGKRECVWDVPVLLIEQIWLERNENLLCDFPRTICYFFKWCKIKSERIEISPSPGRGRAAFYFILLSDQHTNPYIIECECVYWLSSSTSSHVHVVWPTHSKEFSCYPVHQHSYSIPFFMVFYVYGAFFTPFSFGMWILFVYYLCLFVVISSIIATRFIPLFILLMLNHSKVPSFLLHL